MNFAQLLSDQGDLLCATAVACVVTAWCWLYLNRLLAAGFVLSYVATVTVGTGLKLVSAEFAAPPEHTGLFAFSAGAPSGHMALATVVYGTAALFCRYTSRGWRSELGQLICLAVIATVAVTRVTLHYHTIADVVAGFALGAVACVFPSLVLRAKRPPTNPFMWRLLVGMAVIDAITLIAGQRMPSSNFL